MATHWVDVASGNDANGGTNYADAVQTIAAAAILMDADADTTVQLNVVNSGDYTMDAGIATVDPDGTSSQDFIVRGCDSAGVDALTSVIPPATGASFFIGARTCNTFTVKNFDVSWHASRASTGTQGFFGYGENGTQGELILEYCRFRGTTDTSQPNGARQPMSVSGLERNDLKTIRYCSFENMRSCLSMNGSTTYGYSIHDCVFIMDYPTERVSNGFMTGPAYGSAASELSFYNNTIFFNHLYNNSAVALWTSLGGSGDCGTRSFYNNVYWCDTDPDGGDATIPVALIKQTSGTGTPSAGTRGGNVWYTSTEFPDADVLDGYIAGTQWAPDSADNKSFATDSVVNETTEGTLFKDTASAYTWSPSGTDLEWAITKDLRLVAEKTSGVSGALPGALPQADVNPTIALTNYSATVIEKNDRLQLSVSFTEDGSNGGVAGTIITMTIPAEFTVQRTKTSSGSYSSGVWTLGAVTAGATVTLNMWVKVGEITLGDSYTVVSTITSHHSGLPLSGSDNDSVTYTSVDPGGGDGGDGGDVENPDNPARVPLVDVLPTTEPRWALDVNQRLSTERNRKREIYTRYDEEETLFSEYRSGVTLLTTNTSATFNMGGIERATYFQYESDVAVQVSLNGGTFQPAAKHMAIAQSAISSLKFKNTSTSDDAEIYFLVVD